MLFGHTSYNILSNIIFAVPCSIYYFITLKVNCRGKDHHINWYSPLVWLIVRIYPLYMKLAELYNLMNESSSSSMHLVHYLHVFLWCQFDDSLKFIGDWLLLLDLVFIKLQSQALVSTCLKSSCSMKIYVSWGAVSPLSI